MTAFYEVGVAPAAVRAVRSLHDSDRATAKWLLDSLELMSSDPETGDTSVVSAELGLRKRNIGDYKVLYQIREERATIVVLAIERRRGR
ncbi:MAG TPA: type II toxin-antitoxin system RelE/ParE family toxin [Kribbellaceae bacterium]|nr:type II toxin-antitoxin system RelE/ParE family toxin [Kribbellaceae bacterium]